VKPYKILQINTTLSSGSTGRIQTSLAGKANDNGFESYIAYGRKIGSTPPKTFRIGTMLDFIIHLLLSRIFDKHGFGSRNATQKLIKWIQIINPDVVHLHNLHGYYLNIGVLFQYLKESQKPVIWTFHDCWPFTGHCSFFDAVGCRKWESACFECPNKTGYPKSWLKDNSKDNFLRKKHLFSGIKNMVIVVPSQWMAENLKKSFLNNYRMKIINNGINLEIFRPSDYLYARQKLNLTGKYLILGVANIWDKRKGYYDFTMLRKMLPNEYEFLLVGLSENQIKELPDGIKGIRRTESTEELAYIYSAANVFFNPTHVDNFPTVNIESIACGTPVVSYNTGGSSEIIDISVGRIVPKGDLVQASEAIVDIARKGKKNYISICRDRAMAFFDQERCFTEYLSLYSEII
jgi:putative colanic acid biosynthesis glycosyltransferase